MAWPHGVVLLVVWHKDRLLALVPQFLNGALAINDSGDKVASPRIEVALHDGGVSIEHAGLDHRVPSNWNQYRPRWVLNQQPIQLVSV